MDAPWLPQRVVDATQARALMLEAWPSLQVESVESFGAGWDNTAYLVNRAWVVRFPRRASCVVSMQREIAALPVLAPRLPLRIPVPTYACEGTPHFDWPFAAYRLVHGVTACKLALTDAERLRAAPRVAEFLRALHAIDPGVVASAALPEMRLDFAWLATWEERTAERLGMLADAGAVTSSQRRALLRQIEQGRPSEAHALVVSHGDLYVRHFVVDAERQVNGVIDWGDLEVGEVARDLAVAFTMFPPPARDELLAAYGATPSDVALARVVAVHHAMAGLTYAHAQSDDDLRRELLRATHWLTIA